MLVGLGGSPAQYKLPPTCYLRSWREAKRHALALQLKPPTHAVWPCDGSYEGGSSRQKKTEGRDDSGQGRACRMGFHRTRRHRRHRTERCAVLRLAGWAWLALAPTRLQTVRCSCERISQLCGCTAVVVSGAVLHCCSTVSSQQASEDSYCGGIWVRREPFSLALRKRACSAQRAARYWRARLIYCYFKLVRGAAPFNTRHSVCLR